MVKARRVEKALSNAVIAIILVIAAVIITLVLVGFVFGWLGAYSAKPQVRVVSAGALIYNPNTTISCVLLVIHSTGDVQIVNAQILGTDYTYVTSTVFSSYITTITFLNGGEGTATAYLEVSDTYHLTAGTNYVPIFFYGFTPQDGATYTIEITLSDGQILLVPVTVEYSSTTPSMLVTSINGPTVTIQV